MDFLKKVYYESKGKEFDEVIIVDGFRHSRLIRTMNDQKELRQALYLLRVGITRAKRKVTILTSTQDPCPVL